jgi:hypothetical protein
MFRAGCPAGGGTVGVGAPPGRGGDRAVKPVSVKGGEIEIGFGTSEARRPPSCECVAPVNWEGNLRLFDCSHKTHQKPLKNGVVVLQLMQAVQPAIGLPPT